MHLQKCMLRLADIFPPHCLSASSCAGSCLSEASHAAQPGMHDMTETNTANLGSLQEAAEGQDYRQAMLPCHLKLLPCS